LADLLCELHITNSFKRHAHHEKDEVSCLPQRLQKLASIRRCDNREAIPLQDCLDALPQGIVTFGKENGRPFHSSEKIS
jgi:hypothetical protein